MVALQVSLQNNTAVRRFHNCELDQTPQEGPAQASGIQDLKRVWSHTGMNTGTLKDVLITHNTGSIALFLAGYYVEQPITALRIHGNSASGVQLSTFDVQHVDASLELRDIQITNNELRASTKVSLSWTL